MWSTSHRQLNIFLKRVKRAKGISFGLWSPIAQIKAGSSNVAPRKLISSFVSSQPGGTSVVLSRAEGGALVPCVRCSTCIFWEELWERQTHLLISEALWLGHFLPCAWRKVTLSLGCKLQSSVAVPMLSSLSRAWKASSCKKLCVMTSGLHCWQLSSDMSEVEVVEDSFQWCPATG